METVVSHVLDEVLSCRGREDRQTLYVVQGLEIADVIREQFGTLEIHVTVSSLNFSYIFINFISVSAVRCIGSKTFVRTYKGDGYKRRREHLEHHGNRKERLTVEFALAGIRIADYMKCRTLNNEEQKSCADLDITFVT